MSEVKITALKNGPYKVEGAIALYDGATPLAPRTPATFLCRCGAAARQCALNRDAHSQRPAVATAGGCGGRAARGWGRGPRRAAAPGRRVVAGTAANTPSRQPLLRRS